MSDKSQDNTSKRKRGSWIIPKNRKLGRESKKREQEGENSGRAAEEGEQEKLAVTPTGTTVSQKSSPCSTIVVVSVRFCVSKSSKGDSNLLRDST